MFQTGVVHKNEVHFYLIAQNDSEHRCIHPCMHSKKSQLLFDHVESRYFLLNGIITASVVWLLCNINTEGCTQISFQERSKEETEAFLKQLKVVLHDAGDEVASELQDVLEGVKKIQPDLKAVVSSYQNQLKILKEELENDEGFTGASENVLVKHWFFGRNLWFVEVNDETKFWYTRRKQVKVNFRYIVWYTYVMETVFQHKTPSKIFSTKNSHNVFHMSHLKQILHMPLLNSILF